MKINEQQPMDELSAWMQIKQLIDTNDILETVDFENVIIAKGNVDLQRSISKNPFLHKRALCYLNGRRAEFVKETFFPNEEEEK